jgi:hypothetical protein
MAGAAAYMAGTPAPAAPALLLVPLLLSRYFSSRGWPAARAWNGRPSLGNRRAAERGGVPQRAT